MSPSASLSMVLPPSQHLAIHVAVSNPLCKPQDARCGNRVSLTTGLTHQPPLILVVPQWAHATVDLDHICQGSSMATCVVLHAFARLTVTPQSRDP